MAQVKVRVQKSTRYIVEIDDKEFEVEHHPSEIIDPIVETLSPVFR